jgi:hypothetical protein
MRAGTSSQGWIVNTQSSAGNYEKWTLVDPTNTSSIAPVDWNEQVAFRSAHGRYLMSHASGQLTQQSFIGSANERWRLLFLLPD